MMSKNTYVEGETNDKRHQQRQHQEEKSKPKRIERGRNKEIVKDNGEEVERMRSRRSTRR